MKVKSQSEVVQSCLTLSDPMDCSLPGSSVRGILQARILEWVVIPFFRGSSRPRDQTRSPALQADSLSFEPPEKSRPPIIIPILQVKKLRQRGLSVLPKTMENFRYEGR